jgi:transposase-like protein
MAKKGQSFKSYSIEFKEKVLNDYKSGIFGGRDRVAKKYNISSATLWNWINKDRKQGNQIDDIEKKRGRKKEENIDYKERYEILKKYQAFLKAQRERK